MDRRRRREPTFAALPKDGPQIDLRRVLPDELTDALSNDELGQYTRLMLRLLAQPDHTLPPDAAVLARWAGGEPTPGVLAQFSNVDGRLRCARVDAVLSEAHSRRRLLSEAGKRGASKVWGGTRPHAPEETTDRPSEKGAHGHPMAWPWPPHGQAIETARATPQRGFGGASRAHAALERSEKHVIQERSGAGPSETPHPHAEAPTRDAIAGAIYDGLEAAAFARVQEWRRDESRVLLMKAFERWFHEGRITHREDLVDRRSGRVLRRAGEPREDWPSEVPKILRWPGITPGMCELVIQRCDQQHANPDHGRISSTIGFVNTLLGARQGGKRTEPNLHEVPILAKWDALERKVFDSAKVKAAAENAARRIDTAFQNVTPKAGPGQSTSATGA